MKHICSIAEYENLIVKVLREPQTFPMALCQTPVQTDKSGPEGQQTLALSDLFS